MKRKLLFSCLIVVAVFTSCEKPGLQNSDGSQKTSTTLTEPARGGQTSSANKMAPPYPCPRGYHPEYTYEIDQFNFHRPARNCESGFWVCIRGHMEQECVFGGYQTRTAVVDRSGKATIVVRYVDETHLEFHFPMALTTNGGYTSRELQTFNVDDAWEIATGVTLKIGDYAVSQVGDELVAVVETL